MLEMFVEFDPIRLRNQIKAQQISHAELAYRLGVNPKTVQRWVNGYIRRVKPQILQEICAELRCETGDLIIAANGDVQISTQQGDALQQVLNPQLVASLFSDHQKMSYLEVLKRMEVKGISPSTQAQIRMFAGKLCMDLRKFLAAKRHLQKALQLALTAKDSFLEGQIRCFLAKNYLHIGEFAHAREEMTALETVSTKNDYLSDRAYFYLLQGEDSRAEECLRFFIGQSVRNKSHFAETAGAYFEMAELVSHQSLEQKALRFYHRSMKYAVTANCSQLQVYSQYGIALSLKRKNQDSNAQAAMNRAQALQSALAVSTDHRILHLRFHYSLLEKDFGKCREYLNERFKLLGSAKEQIVDIAIDGLYLEKTSEGKHLLRRTWLERALTALKAVGGFRKLQDLDLMMKEDLCAELSPKLTVNL